MVRTIGSRQGRLVLCLLVGIVSVSSCAKDSPTADGVVNSRDERGVVAEESSVLPFDSLVDWKRYADEVVLATVDAESEIVSESDAEKTEYSLGRRLQLTVTDTYFERIQGPTEASVVSTGWIVSDEKGRREVRAARYSPYGRKYLCRQSLPDAGWRVGLQNHESVVGVSEGRLVVASDAHPGVRTLDGKTLEEFEKLLSSTESDPVATQYSAYNSIDMRAIVGAKPGSDRDSILEQVTPTTTPR